MLTVILLATFTSQRATDGDRTMFATEVVVAHALECIESVLYRREGDILATVFIHMHRL